MVGLAIRSQSNLTSHYTHSAMSMLQIIIPCYTYIYSYIYNHVLGFIIRIIYIYIERNRNITEVNKFSEKNPQMVSYYNRY